MRTACHKAGCKEDMTMKKMIMLLVLVCLLFAGCGEPQIDTQEPESGNAGADVTTPEADQEDPARTVAPLPDSTMDNLTDAVLAISLEEGDAYVDDTGKMQMDVKIYTYDKYDMVDISNLQVGDVIMTHTGEVEVTALDRTESGLVFINGGLEEGGFDLFTDESGIFYEQGFNDVKSWYEVGEATIRVSADFMGYDNADLEKGELLIYP